MVKQVVFAQKKKVQKKSDSWKKASSVIPTIGKSTERKANFTILWKNAKKAQYAYEYAKKRWFTHTQALYLVAQIHQENGTWDETRRWDKWCSVGLTQWNECVRGKIPYKSYEGQIRLLIDEIKRKYDMCGNFRQAQTAWNKPAVLRSWNYKTVYFYQTEKVFEKLF